MVIFAWPQKLGFFTGRGAMKLAGLLQVLEGGGGGGGGVWGFGLADGSAEAGRKEATWGNHP